MLNSKDLCSKSHRIIYASLIQKRSSCSRRKELIKSNNINNNQKSWLRKKILLSWAPVANGLECFSFSLLDVLSRSWSSAGTKPSTNHNRQLRKHVLGEGRCRLSSGICFCFLRGCWSSFEKCKTHRMHKHHVSRCNLGKYKKFIFWGYDSWKKVSQALCLFIFHSRAIECIIFKTFPWKSYSGEVLDLTNKTIPDIERSQTTLSFKHFIFQKISNKIICNL